MTFGVTVGLLFIFIWFTEKLYVLFKTDSFFWQYSSFRCSTLQQIERHSYGENHFWSPRDKIFTEMHCIVLRDVSRYFC